jgi:hypothetical protein
MNNKINVEQMIQKSKKIEQQRYIIIMVSGIFLPLILWLFYFKKLESLDWRGFFTVVIFIVMGFFLFFGLINLLFVQFRIEKFRDVLTKYASMIENIEVPEDALFTACLRSGAGRFGFDAVKYRFWKEADELVFYPACPEYKTAKFYSLVQAVRLNIFMVRSYYVTGKQFSLVKSLSSKKEYSKNGTPAPQVTSPTSVYRDTRATVIAYAVGNQTVYLTFTLNLYDVLTDLLPQKDKIAIEKHIEITA